VHLVPRAMAVGVILSVAFSLGGTASASWGPKANVTLTVPATAGPMGYPFFGTGLVRTNVLVSAHHPVVAAGSGVASFGNGRFPPTGNPQYCPAPADNLAPGVGCGADLLARVGNARWVAIGYGPACLTGEGRVTLATNDSYYADNGGAFAVTLRSAHATHGVNYPGRRLCRISTKEATATAGHVRARS